MQELLLSGLVGTLGFESEAALRLTGALCLVAAYLIGSINFAVIFSRAFFHEDVREKGSGNAGSTNMLRNYGWKVAVLTLVCDALKAAIATALGLLLMPYATGFAYVSGFFCLVGHAFPVFFHFRGGKSVASLAGVILVLNPLLFGLLLVLFVLIIALFGYVSLGSIVCALAFPVFNVIFPFWFSPVPPTAIVFSLLAAVLVVFLHRQNIGRLWRGEEPRFSLRGGKT